MDDVDEAQNQILDIQPYDILIQDLLLDKDTETKEVIWPALVDLLEEKEYILNKIKQNGKQHNSDNSTTLSSSIHGTDPDIILQNLYMVFNQRVSRFCKNEGYLTGEEDDILCSYARRGIILLSNGNNSSLEGSFP